MIDRCCITSEVEDEMYVRKKHDQPETYTHIYTHFLCRKVCSSRDLFIFFACNHFFSLKIKFNCEQNFKKNLG